ncbi:MAG TPA: DUF520 family protein, partial [Candidatus Limnocylindrales bacterium]|nr:DUF520 family protein [Candidatus Limnocylindrales bacterium]
MHPVRVAFVYRNDIVSASSRQCDRVRQIITIVQGIPKEKGREIVALIKETRRKVQSQIQDEQARVTGKSI